MKKTNYWLLSLFIFNISLFSSASAQTAKPVIFAPGVVSSEFMETTATFTPDGKIVYFTRSDMQFSDNTILESQLKNGKWSEPQVASFSGIWRDSEPNVSPDGKRLFFVSNRPVSAGGEPITANFGNRTFPGANIWYVERKANGDWGEPVHIEGAMNEFKTVYNPSVARNGTLYFSGVLPDDPTKNQIYKSVLANGVYGKPEKVSFSETKWNHMDPSVDPDERFMVFASNRPGAINNSNDVFIVFQKDGKWGEPVAFGESVNSPALENAPVLAPGGRTLYFTSMRLSAGAFPKAKKETYQDMMRRLRNAENGSRNIWQIDIGTWLEREGIK
jgi:hypothetical protein